MKVYVNGKLEGDAANGVPIAPSALELWIGGDDFGNATDFFPGKIDEVRLYEKDFERSRHPKGHGNTAGCRSTWKTRHNMGKIKGRTLKDVPRSNRVW